MYRHTRLPGASAGYLAAREELRLAEIELMRHRERVAAQRRALPAGPAVEDYVFLLDLTPGGRGDWYAGLDY
ncbi:DUF899 family protein [Streptomyces sp. NPDC058733]|uniref:DUF899 family protein n=1 Tax=unclassified Streptomyces TaxID=2593676 RepID=UPI0036A1C6FF